MSNSSDSIETLPAELTLERLAEVQERLIAQVRNGVRTFDLSTVQRCDAAGLQLLISLARSHSADRPFLFLSPSEAIRCVAQSVGLDLKQLTPDLN